MTTSDAFLPEPEPHVDDHDAHGADDQETELEEEESRADEHVAAGDSGPGDLRDDGEPVVRRPVAGARLTMDELETDLDDE